MNCSQSLQTSLQLTVTAVTMMRSRSQNRGVQTKKKGRKRKTLQKVNYELQPISSDFSPADSDSSDDDEEWLQNRGVQTKKKGPKRKTLQKQNGSIKQKDAAVLPDCLICGKNFQHIGPLIKHIEEHRETSESTKKLLMHLHSAQNQRLICDICGKKFTNTGSVCVLTLRTAAERRSRSVNCWPLESNLDYRCVQAAARAPIITLFQIDVSRRRDCDGVHPRAQHPARCSIHTVHCSLYLKHISTQTSATEITGAAGATCHIQKFFLSPGWKAAKSLLTSSSTEQQ
ncbi:hypothetical protein F7725_003495, partial [Dissostichus mawsoni]